MKTVGGFLLSQIRQRASRSFEKILKTKGIDAFNGPQGRILYVLWEQEDLSITEIARLTSLANTTLTGMLDRMEEQGLVVRVPDPAQPPSDPDPADGQSEVAADGLRRGVRGKQRDLLRRIYGSGDPPI